MPAERINNMKKITYITLSAAAILVATWAYVSASTTPSNLPTLGTNNSASGTQAWTNPGNITLSDTVSATANGSSIGPRVTQYVEGQGFAFHIPYGSTINGIQLEINRKKSAGTDSVKDATVFLVTATGTIASSTNRADTTTLYTTSYASAIYGNSSDLWGQAWAPSDINSPNFGATLQSSFPIDTAAITVSVDYFKITVTYTPPPTTVHSASVQMVQSSVSVAQSSAYIQ